jgi:chaperonin cofactor prefoldin
MDQPTDITQRLDDLEAELKASFERISKQIEQLESELKEEIAELRAEINAAKQESNRGVGYA